MRLHIIGVGLCIALSACGNSDSAPTADTGPGDVSPLSDAEYRALSGTQRYAAANTLLATLYQGAPAPQFFNLTGDLKNPTVKPDAPELERIRTALTTPLSPADSARYLARANSYTYFTETTITPATKYYSTQPLVLPQAILFESPLSKDYYHRWMAYVLMNTILFSPALELESVRSPAVSNVYDRLVTLLGQGRTMRDIVYDHMISPANWERFRSPEDNTREMLEIFLARFIDAEVPPATTACKNWGAGRDPISGVAIINKGQNVNTVPQTVLGTTVVTCEDFYRALVDHPDLIPTIATVLVNHFFSDNSLEAKRKLIASIVAAQPKTFDALFSLVLFSKQYLLYTARAKNAEESFFGLARRVGWKPSPGFFDNFTDGRNSAPSSITLLRMGQATMLYKLGRASRAPTNTLHFSLHHKLIRESLLLNQDLGAADSDRGWPAAKLLDDPAVMALAGDNFIHYLFLSVVVRHAQPTELDALNKIIAAKGYATNRVAKAAVVFDYLSRLPELYSFRENKQAIYQTTPQVLQ